MSESLSTFCIMPQESCERIAKYFSTISQEFPPININLLPKRVQDKLLVPDKMKDAPSIETYQVYERIKSAKKTKSCVPGDIPPKILKEFSVEIADPAASIMKSINRTGIFPDAWKKEFVTPIPKVNPPSSEDELRNISLTPFLSKIYEGFMVTWLLPYLLPYLDPGQLGGLKGCSITHYMIKLFHFIFKTGDMPTRLPHSVLLALIDFSKAFNRMDHNLLITLLSDSGVPSWLLTLSFSYLSNRKMVVRYRGNVSSEENLPGGGPQGTLLGGLFFLFQVNKAGWQATDNDDKKTPPPEVDSSNVRLKYWDDLSLGSTINLKTSLCTSIDRSGPKNFHDRFGYVLPPENSNLQTKLNTLDKFTKENSMKINESKTVIMPFNFTKKYDFFPKIKFPEAEKPLKVVYETKLLGIICTSDGKFKNNTIRIVKKATSKLWMIRRLKWFGADKNILLEAYILHVSNVYHYGILVLLWKKEMI